MGYRDKAPGAIRATGPFGLSGRRIGFSVCIYAPSESTNNSDALGTLVHVFVCP